jgi:hypothetical protein
VAKLVEAVGWRVRTGVRLPPPPLHLLVPLPTGEYIFSGFFSIDIKEWYTIAMTDSGGSYGKVYQESKGIAG